MNQITTPIDPFGVRDTLDTGSGPATFYRLSRLQDQGIGDIDRLPYSIRVLLESVLRNCDGPESGSNECVALWLIFECKVLHPSYFISRRCSVGVGGWREKGSTWNPYRIRGHLCG